MAIPVIGRAWTAWLSRLAEYAGTSTGPPRLRHHLDDSLLCAAVCGLLRHVIGTALTVILALIVLALLPLVIVIRLALSLRSRWRKRDEWRWQFRHCDPWWPLSRISSDRPNIAVVTLPSTLDAQLLSKQLQRILPGTVCDVDEENDYRSSPSPSNASCNVQHVRLWDQKKHRLKDAKDLRLLLNSPDSLIRHCELCSITIVPNFSNSPQNGNNCCLLLISHNYWKCCLLRLIAQLAAGQLAFDVEPKMSRLFAIESPRFSLPLALCQGLCQFFQFVCIGPLSIVTLAIRRTDDFWSHLNVGSRQSFLLKSPPQHLRKRDSRNSNVTASAPEVEGLIVDDHRSALTDSINPNISTNEQRTVRWMRITNMEQMGRAERILRAATIEMLLACVAGTMRRHFRAQGLRHPPDIGACVPCSRRETLPIAASACCQMVLIPIHIPSSVEGCIPRIWAVQRRLADALDGVLPNALRTAKVLSDLTLSSFGSQWFMSNIYGDTSTVVGLFRASNEAQLDSQKIHSLLLYPALSKRVKIAFTFVQCGSELMLSVSSLKECIPDCDRILSYFKIEIHSLLEQLAMRLMTLSQATFLPNRVTFTGVPPILLADDHDERPSKTPESSPSIARSRLSAGSSFDAQITGNEHEQLTFEELQRLLLTVQKELDSMKNNPMGDRTEYIRKLTDLERRMQSFHECMTSRLAPQAAAAIVPDAELATSAVAELLAPYRSEAGAAGRRFSREFVRIDNMQRKMSRNVDVFHST